MFTRLELLNTIFSKFYMQTGGAADFMNLTGILLQHWLPKNLNKDNQFQRFIYNVKGSSETVNCG
jgi:hypothetical protein